MKGIQPARVRDAGLDDFDHRVQQALASTESLSIQGRVVEVLGNVVKVTGLQCQVGELCELRSADGALLGHAEIIGFSGSSSFLSPLGNVSQLSSQVRVVPLQRPHAILVGDAVLGRVLNGYGTPIDSLDTPITGELRAVDQNPPNPMTRLPIREPFETGIRAIDTLLTCGVGQRMGIFAPAGVGKSTLLGELAKNAKGQADVNVVALIGERGREVGEFIRSNLDEETLTRTVIVVATSDRTAMERVRAAQVATAIAESFRDLGRNVLLLMDSLTRLARAQREIGLAIGEPPTRRGYPPSVFSLLPRLLERTGMGSNASITAFYTILTEGDEVDDPVAEEVRAILDGHIILSRSLAAANHHPAIDVLHSTSRVADLVSSDEQRLARANARTALADYDEIELLVQIGEYKPGTSASADTAVSLHPLLKSFCQQPSGTGAVSRADSFDQLSQLLQQSKAMKDEPSA